MGDEDDAAALVRQVPEHAQGLLGLIQAHARGGLVGDDQPGVREQGSAHQNPLGHAAGELEGVEALRLLRQAEAAEERPALRCGPGLFMAVRLTAHLHEGVQVGHGLGHQGDLAPPQDFLPFRGEGFAAVAHGALHRGVPRQDAQDGGGQQALAGPRGPRHRQNLPRMDREAEIADDLQTAPLQGAVVHEEGDGEVADLQKRLFFVHGVPPIPERCRGPRSCAGSPPAGR